MRRHPCHACPDREQHARYAERYFRQYKEIEDLERQVGGRQHVIARTFQRVCAVLDELGYTDGDTVTPAGQRLTRLYSELDLVAAECLRRGLWEGLNPAELAACVSVLSFESRRQVDDAEPARLPKGPVRDVLNVMARTWGELDQLEQRNGLSFLREPDPGFVWAAYRWCRGAKLEDVLDSVPSLTPGDFVRSMKQLIDLLDQIAGASRDPARAGRAARVAWVAWPRGRTAQTLPRAAQMPQMPRLLALTPLRVAVTPLRAAGKPTGWAAETPADLAVTPLAGDGDAGGLGGGDADAAGVDAAPAGERPDREPARKQRDVASTARAAIDAMRRGVIAYSTLTD